MYRDYLHKILKKMRPSSKKNIAFELKGSLFTLTVLHLFDANMSLFTTQLEHHAQQTPNFFKNTPLVIDLQRLSNADHEIDFNLLQHQLRGHSLIPVGVRNGNEQLNQAAQAAGFAILSNQPNQSHKTLSDANVSKAADVAAITHTLVVNKPIRSGQQVYAKQANLVVLAPVSHGAELLADGYIHAYDSLRGRVLAGINGDVTARIFCHKLEAELVSIAGHYRLNENLPTITAPTVQIYLEDEKIHIEGVPLEAHSEQHSGLEE